MKFCLINNLYKPCSRGGAEKVVEITAKGLRNAGHNVFIITTSVRRRSYAEEIDGIKVYRIYSPNLATYYNIQKLPKFLRVFWHFFDMFNFLAASDVVKIIDQETNQLVALGKFQENYIKPIRVFNY